MLNNIKEGQKANTSLPKTFKLNMACKTLRGLTVSVSALQASQTTRSFWSCSVSLDNPSPLSTWEMPIYSLNSQLSSVPLRRFSWPSLGNINCSHLNVLISPMKFIITCFLTSSFIFEFPGVRNYILFIFVSLVPREEPST